MAVTFLKQAERRAEELEAELSADPRYAELKGLRAVIAAHKLSQEARPAAKPVVPAEATVRAARGEAEAGAVALAYGAVVVPTPKVSRGKALVEATVVLLKQSGRYMNSTEIAAKLTEQGYDLSAKSTPQAYLASFLSGSPLIENIKGHGYGLKEWRVNAEAAPRGAFM